MIDDDARFVKAALDRLPTPAHRPGFWDQLEDQLVRTRPRRHRGPLLAAAAIVLVALAVAVVVLRDDGARRVDVATPPPPTADAAARDAAIAWIDALARGDMQSAWDALGPASRDAWSSYDAFDQARTDFSEGLGKWASARDRKVEAVTVSDDGATSIHVVTFTGRDDAYAVVVRRMPSGRDELEPFTPQGTIGLQLVAPQSASQPVSTSVPGGARDLRLVVDGVVHPTADLTYLPDGGWTPGFHVVTAYAMYADGTPAATAVVFVVQ